MGNRIAFNQVGWGPSDMSGGKQHQDACQSTGNANDDHREKDLPSSR
jgi:hypothetical protein